MSRGDQGSVCLLVFTGSERQGPGAVLNTCGHGQGGVVLHCLFDVDMSFAADGACSPTWK